jgi:C4-dicarboxylate transporter DctQ subunit
VWTTFFGGAYGVRKAAHIGVEAITMLLPRVVKQILQLVITACCLVLCAIIFKYGLDIVKNQLARGQLSPALRIPMGYMYLAIPAGMAMFIIRYIQSLYLTIMAMVRPAAGEGQH